LFSEPQVHTDTLIDLQGLGWPALTASPAGLQIAATCTIAELHAFAGPADWHAVPLFGKCIDAFLMSFKIWNAATVGGNICMSLPAGAMISLTAALEGVCTLWPRAGQPRQVPVVDFVTGNHANVLQKGELLRSIHLPAAALSKRFAMRQASLTQLGRSAALIIGTAGDKGEDFLLTISAATPRPVHLRFAKMPSAAEMRQAIDTRLPHDAWFEDVHGSAAYKRHVTHYLAEQIRQELA
jgi:CO/xanthine dehydrogenase FAD-binding subunit